MKNKENLFSKNNYDIQLEQILENKQFSDDARSLILNILYKIDIAYKDYSKIKYDVKLKNEIIAEIINIVEHYCDNIEVVDPKNTKNKFTVDRDKKTIKVFPNEVSLLQALYYISTSEYKNKKNVFDKAIMNVVNKGKALNGTEIIRDFNGWSWNNAIDNNLSMYYNLIFQNLIILIGSKSLDALLKSGNFRQNLIGQLQSIYGEKKSEEIIKKINICSILIYMHNSKKNQNEVENYLKRQEKSLNLLENKSQYISKITLKNNKSMQTISKIENILNNRNLLEKKYLRPNIKERYKMLENYKEHLIRVHKKKSEEINRNARLISPFEYVKRKKSLNDEVELLQNIKNLSNKKSSVYTSIIDLQRSIISCFYKKIEVYDLKKELINLVYEIRYYNHLPLNGDTKIKDTKELDVDLRNVKKKLVTKLCDNKILDTFSKDYGTDYLILEYIFVTKTINITKLDVKLQYKNKKLFLEYYDENVLESNTNLNFSEDDFKDLTKRTDRKIKMFI